MNAPPPDFSAQLAQLRLAGAQQLDPVRCHYLQALLARAAGHQGELRRLLDARLGQGLQALRQRVEQAQREAGPAPANPAQLVPRAPLSELLAYLAQRAPEQVDASLGAAWPGVAAARPELRSVRHFRHTWSKLSVDKQMTKALDQAPKNAGPINSHMLVLRSLSLMREISPDYLKRFLAYAEALLCLEQSDLPRPAQPKKPARAKAAKK